MDGRLEHAVPVVLQQLAACVEVLVPVGHHDGDAQFLLSGPAVAVVVPVRACDLALAVRVLRQALRRENSAEPGLVQFRCGRGLTMLGYANALCLSQLQRFMPARIKSSSMQPERQKGLDSVLSRT